MYPKRHPYSRQLTKDKDTELINNYRNPAFVLKGWVPDSCIKWDEVIISGDKFAHRILRYLIKIPETDMDDLLKLETENF